MAIMLDFVLQEGYPELGANSLTRFIHHSRKLQASGDSVSERNARAYVWFPQSHHE